MTTTPQAYTWGRIYAVLDHTATITPTAWTNIAQAPGLHFAGRHKMSLSRFTPELVAMMGEITADLAPENVQDRLCEEEQATFWLGYHHQRAKIDTPAGKPGLGARRGNARIDWPAVDWSKNNADIARELGCAPTTVLQQRKRHTSE